MDQILTPEEFDYLLYSSGEIDEDWFNRYMDFYNALDELVRYWDQKAVNGITDEKLAFVPYTDDDGRLKNLIFNQTPMTYENVYQIGRIFRLLNKDRPVYPESRYAHRRSMGYICPACETTNWCYVVAKKDHEIPNYCPCCGQKLAKAKMED